MKYRSTRGQIEPVDFQDAVLMGLADDGGLIIPESIPDVTDRLEGWSQLAYPQLAREVLRLFVTDIPDEDLRELLERTYSEPFDNTVAPIVPVGGVYIQELWHGPTLAFKDVALQLLGNLFEYILQRRGGRLNILGATSGDTGSAAIHGCRGRSGIDIFVMHPHGRTSPIQRRQMTTVTDANVHNIAIEGSFDDCQTIMKAIAGDLDFKRRYSLGAVNSVNWARVLAQIVYYFYGAFEAQRQGSASVRFAVPTGNFGDILAGWYAKRMGAPIDRLILATNENDILARFFNDGVYERGEVHRTLSPSMDIQVASNFERYLFYRLGEDPAVLRRTMQTFAETGRIEVDGSDEDFQAASAGRDEVLATIRTVWEHHGYVLDPHTAVGVAVAGQLGAGLGRPDVPGVHGTMICLATAHPSKFPDAIAEATGRDDLTTHPTIEALMDRPERFEVLPADIAAVKQHITATLGEQ